MRRRIEVKVIEPADRDYFYLRWKDDRNGRRRTESTKILQTRGDRGRAAAERMAGRGRADGGRKGDRTEIPPQSPSWNGRRSGNATRIRPKPT